MIITLASSKGGAGKSTACACLSSALALHGSYVHVIDLDQNQTLARWSKIVNIDNLDIAAISEENFLDHLDEKRSLNLFDHIFIDIAGSYDKALTIAVGQADAVIIPMKPAEPDFQEALKTRRTIVGIEKTFDIKIPHAGLLTDVHPLPNHITKFIEGETKRLGLELFKTRLITRQVYRAMYSTGKPPHIDNPEGKAASEIDALLSELIAMLPSKEGHAEIKGEIS
jgi:chromosome partitioning protein